MKTSLIDLTPERALELLERAVAERGEDYVYQQHVSNQEPLCTYAHSGEPDCIVGHVLHYAGVDIETLKTFDSMGSIRTVACSEDGLSLTDRTADVLAVAQGQQDNGYTWGAALEAARRRAGDL